MSDGSKSAGHALVFGVTAVSHKDICVVAVMMLTIILDWF